MGLFKRKQPEESKRIDVNKYDTGAEIIKPTEMIIENNNSKTISNSSDENIDYDKAIKELEEKKKKAEDIKYRQQLEKAGVPKEQSIPVVYKLRAISNEDMFNAFLEKTELIENQIANINQWVSILAEEYKARNKL